MRTPIADLFSPPLTDEKRDGMLALANALMGVRIEPDDEQKDAEQPAR